MLVLIAIDYLSIHTLAVSTLYPPATLRTQTTAIDSPAASLISAASVAARGSRC